MKVRRELGFWRVEYETGKYRIAAKIVKSFRNKGLVCYAVSK